MIARVIISLLILASLAPAFAVPARAKEETKPTHSLTPFEDPKTNLFGYSSSTGKVVLPAQYDWASPFNEHGIAFVLTREGFVYINEQGEELVTPFLFDNFPDEFRQGLARFVKDKKMGMINKRGEVVVKAEYDFLEPVRDGKIVFCLGCTKEYVGEHYTVVGGNWGCMDTKGHITVKPVPTAKDNRFDDSVCYK